jgi:hypothetical protein
MNGFYGFCVYVGYFFLVLNVALYTISFFQGKKANGFFMVYLYFSFLMNAVMHLLYMLHKDNLIVMNFFFIGDMVLLGLFYASILKNKTQEKVVKSSVVIVLLLLLVQIMREPDQLFKYNLFEIAITCLATILFALMHMYNMLTGKKVYYFFTIGLLLYLCSSTILYLVGGLTILFSKSMMLITWILNAILIIIYHLFILYEWKVSFLSTKRG